MNAPPSARPETAAHALQDRLAETRARTLALAAPLSAEDCQAQSMPDASPVKWHLAHTTWFFETFVLERFEPDHRPFDPAFRVLYNSYYQGVGERHPRPERGLVTRPDLATVRAWRAAVDERLAALLARELPPAALVLLELGLQHEQQHQELILTDLKHLLSCNPTDPAYAPAPLPAAAAQAPPLEWSAHPGGVVEIGHAGEGFAFDNETPRHRQWLRPHALASRPVSEGEWAAFVADGGYREPRWWLAAGWDWLQAQRIAAPLYQRDGTLFTLNGRRAADPAAPVVHVSYYEAEAYCRWRAASERGCAGARLPTEAEWEAAAQREDAAAAAAGWLAERGALHPQPADARQAPMTGNVWVWTASAYLPYPGFRAWAGEVGEYNGKFMINQMVLRGGSIGTPRSHLRASYRNFFPPDARWQFSGLRLARDLD